ncbi:MAG: hypothetical protein Q9193_005615, partial [Seirophora villosa]
MASDLTLDVDSLLSDVDVLGPIKNAQDIHEALGIARDALLEYYSLNELVQRHAGYNISLIWDYIREQKLAHPQHTDLIDEWSRSLQEEVTQAKVDHYHSLTAKTRERMTYYNSRIYTAWRVKASEILAPRHYNQLQYLSQDCLAGLAQLAEVVPLDRGRVLLDAEIQSRVLKKATGFKDTDLHLKLRDVNNAKARAGLGTPPITLDSPPSSKPMRKRKATQDKSWQPRARSRQLSPPSSSVSTHDERSVSQSRPQLVATGGLEKKLPIFDLSCATSSGSASSSPTSPNGSTLPPPAPSRDDLPPTTKQQCASEELDVAATPEQARSNTQPLPDAHDSFLLPGIPTPSQHPDQSSVLSEHPTLSTLWPASGDIRDIPSMRTLSQAPSDLDWSERSPALSANQQELPTDYEGDLNSDSIGVVEDLSFGPSQYQSANHLQQRELKSASNKNNTFDSDEDNVENESHASASRKDTDDGPGTLHTHDATFVAPDTIHTTAVPNPGGPPPPSRNAPQSTLSYAISTLAGHKWLSTTAIDLLIRMIPGEDIRIYDPSFMIVDQPMLMQKQPDRSWPTVLGILPTIHRNNHWTLIVMDPVHTQVEFYNSLPSQVYESEAQAAVESWASSADAGHNGPGWRFGTKECFVQPNGFDCGILVIINAMQRILGLTVPTPIDLKLWRRVFQAVLTNYATSTSTAGAPTQEPVAMSTTPSLITSSTVKPSEEVLDDEASLRAEFERKEELLAKARRKHRMASEAATILQHLQSENTRCLKTSEALRASHQEVLRDYKSLFNTFLTFNTQYTEVGIALKSSIDKDERGLRQQEKRFQHLQRAQGGWQAGLRVCEGEQTIQTQHCDTARASIQNLVQRLQLVRERLLRMAQSAEQLTLEWKDKLRAS